MNPLTKALRSAASELAAAGVDWALIGGLAISARLEPRFTRDLDLAVAVADDGTAEALVRRFRGQGYAINTVLEQETTGRLATVRLQTPAGEEGPLVDLLFASSGIEREVTAEAEPIRIAAGLVVPVARLGHLLAMKILSRDDQRRPQDLLDIRNILNAAGSEELERARSALALIQDRGFGRKKSLLNDLDALLHDR